MGIFDFLDLIATITDALALKTPY